MLAFPVTDYAFQTTDPKVRGQIKQEAPHSPTETRQNYRPEISLNLLEIVTSIQYSTH